MKNGSSCHILDCLAALGPVTQGGVKQRGLEKEEVCSGEVKGPEDADRLEEGGEVGGVQPGPGAHHQLLQLFGRHELGRGDYEQLPPDLGVHRPPLSGWEGTED